MSSTQAEVTRPAPAFANLAKAANFIIPVAIGVVLWFIPAPEGLNVKAWQMFAIFVATIAGIILAPLPMSAVALIGATVATLLGVIPFSAVVDATGTDLVWLVMLAFFISRGVIKSGLGRRIALLFMRLLGKRTIGLGYGLALTELIIAPAMPSITARAGGVMLPITRAISEVLGSEPNTEFAEEGWPVSDPLRVPRQYHYRQYVHHRHGGQSALGQAGSRSRSDDYLDWLGSGRFRSWIPLSAGNSGDTLVACSAGDRADPRCACASQAGARDDGPDVFQ